MDGGFPPWRMATLPMVDSTSTPTQRGHPHWSDDLLVSWYPPWKVNSPYVHALPTHGRHKYSGFQRARLN